MPSARRSKNSSRLSATTQIGPPLAHHRTRWTCSEAGSEHGDMATRCRPSTVLRYQKALLGNDVLVCPFCHGPRRLLAFLTDPSVVRSILAHLGLPLGEKACIREVQGHEGVAGLDLLCPPEARLGFLEFSKEKVGEAEIRKIAGLG